MPLLWGGKMTEDIIAIIEKQGGIPGRLSTDEFRTLVINICKQSQEMTMNSWHFTLFCCWYAMQYGRIAGVREERRKKKKAAQRCSTERQEATKHTKV